MAEEKKLEGGRKVSGVIIPPEGGWGWMIVAGCFLATICIRAVTRCVSIFFVEFQLHFKKDYSSIAWIHSLIDCTTMLCAPLGGFLANRISCRATMILGGLLSSIGLVLGSFASCLEHLYICLGILTGLGFALSYTPAIAMVGRYFVERKALAYGIALSGTGIGQFILAPVVQMLIEHYSWRGALLIMGGFVSNLCVCGALMRPLKPRGTKRLWDNTVAHLERDCMTSMLDLKDGENVAADCSQEEPQRWKTNLIKDHGLLIPYRGQHVFALDNNKQAQGRMGFLSNFSLRDQSLSARKVAKCILLSNKLTETLQGGVKHPDSNLTNGGITEELELTESMNSNNKAADMDEKIENLALSEIKSNDVYPLDELVSTPPECMVNTRTASRSCFCLKSREEFGFLLSSEFLTLALSIVIVAYACSTPVIYLIPYAHSVGVGHKQAALLMSTLGISSIVGNVTFGWIADRKCVRRYRMQSFMAAIGMDGLCCVFVPLLQSFSLLVPFSVLFGYFEGVYVGLIPVVTSDVAGSTYLTSALGVVYFLHAIPYLISPPIGGWLVDRTGNYAATFFLSAASFLSCSVVLGAAMLFRRCCRSRSSSAVRLSLSRIDAAAAQQGPV